MRLVYVTPSHEAPTGAILSAARRHTLLAWTRAGGAYPLEDDHDGELRYSGPPITALAAMDTDGRVIYCGTFAKALFPSVRLGYLVLPRAARERGSQHEVALGARIASADAAAPGARIDGLRRYDRHIRRMQRRYAARRAALTDALILGYGLVDEHAIETGVRRLAAAYRALPKWRRRPN